jgi:hypothetical protein
MLLRRLEACFCTAGNNPNPLAHKQIRHLLRLSTPVFAFLFRFFFFSSKRAKIVLHRPA